MQKFFKNRIFIYVAIFVAIFVLLNIIIPEKYLSAPIRNAFYKIISPLASSLYKGGESSGGFLDRISKIRRLDEEKSNLEKKVAELITENSKLHELERENELLKNQLGLKEELKNSEFIAADVIGRGPTNISNTLLLNKGSDNGLAEGMPVVTNNMLLGKLTDVSSDHSRVLLIVDPASVINVMVQETRAAGILKGEAGFNLKIESVPQEAPLKKGQRIVTSGLGGTLPKGLIIGEAEEIKSSESEIFQSARVKPYADFNHLEVVFIIKS